jgi:hypothetical protein
VRLAKRFAILFQLQNPNSPMDISDDNNQARQPPIPNTANAPISPSSIEEQPNVCQVDLALLLGFCEGNEGKVGFG